MHEKRISTPKEAAIAVANIPYHLGIVHRSENSKKMISQYLTSAEEEALSHSEGCESLTVAGWPLRYNPAMDATENFYSQISSPQTMLIKRKGSLMEHAILLCGLLQGMGCHAYIAVGRSMYIDTLLLITVVILYLSTLVKRRPYVWVVTISNVSSEDDEEMADEFTPCTISYYVNDEQPPITYQRTQFKCMGDAVKVQESNKYLKVVHWDPLTGSYDGSGIPILC
jgi:hypothetical protein